MPVPSDETIVKLPRGIWSSRPTLDFEDLRLGRHAQVVAALESNPRTAWDDWLLAMWGSGSTDGWAILVHRTLSLFVAVRAADGSGVVVLADRSVRSPDRERAVTAVAHLTMGVTAGRVPRDWLRGAVGHASAPEPGN